MHCPFCKSQDIRVVDSRPSEEGNSIRRRRECSACARRFTTYETIELAPVLVVKKDGTREGFDPGKIRAAVIKACGKRPVSSTDVDKLVHTIEKRVQNRLSNEITSQEVGEMVMEGLLEVDEVAYVRFASVYRQFRDIPTFMVELQKMIDHERGAENLR